jgi:EmrB/QacA subfamily drug resistance transporter
MSTKKTTGALGPWAAMAVLALGLFMTLLDLTIVNIAIPSIIDGIGASLDGVLWVLNAYSLVYAVLLISAGRLGDLFGPRNMFVGGVALFTVASAFAGLAHEPMQLILARGAQGLGAALLAPQGLPIMTSLFPPQRRGAVFAIYGILGGLAVASGPTLGGLIVTHLSWRWIFYVNLPVGVLIIALALLLVPDLRPGRRHRLDFGGVALATAALLCITFGLIEGQRYDWGEVYSFVTIPGVLGAGALLLAVFLLVQYLRQDGEPLLPFAVFRDRNYSLMTLVLAAMGFAMLGLFLPLTIYLQSVLGLSALQAGLTLLPQPLAMMLVAGAAGSLADRHGGKYILMSGLLLFACGMGYVDWISSTDSGRWEFLPGLIVSGLGLGCVWGPAYSLATRNLRPHLAGVASGVLNTMQELGAVIASAAVGALLQNRLAVALQDQAERRAQVIPAPFRGRFVDGFSHASEKGLRVGAGQAGGDPQFPPGVPVGRLEQLAHQVFTHGFIDAMHPTLILPILVVLAAAAGCLAIQSDPKPPPQRFEQSEEAEKELAS